MNKQKNHLLLLLVIAVPGLIAGYSQRRSESVNGPHREWVAYGGGPEQIRYSSLRQINRTNVKQLEVAWTYDTGETGGLQTQPVVVGGILYAYTPTHKAVAVRAGTGQHVWTFDP